MWGACKSDWIAGLESHLKGWALTIYNGMCDQGKSYEDIKKALRCAFPGVVDPFKTKNLIKLVNLKREVSEPLPVFFMRVDQIIRETYPHLEEHSHKLQVRDTFLMKLEANIASKIATYCTTRNDFEPDTVQEAAIMVGAPDFLNPNTPGDSVLLLQPSAAGPMANTPALQLGRKDPDMKCLLCAGSWHPVSACILYSSIFSCPLCQEEPHSIRECGLYQEWAQIRDT